MKKINNKKGEVATFLLIAMGLSAVFGHYQYSKGKWGKEGTERIESKSYWYQTENWRP